MKLSEILRSFKEELKEKQFWNTTRHLNISKRAPQVGGHAQLFGV